MCDAREKKAIAVLQTDSVSGIAVATREKLGTRLHVEFTKLPAGDHGFHIHRAGDLRGAGCAGACEHFHVGAPTRHGAAPRHTRRARHTGDLGNVRMGRAKTRKYTYFLRDIKPRDLWGRSLIVHADKDDLGRGDYEDSGTTGHSGARIACAIFGRA
jgi:Cu-Zn family superoxide dismutase